MTQSSISATLPAGTAYQAVQIAPGVTVVAPSNQSTARPGDAIHRSRPAHGQTVIYRQLPAPEPPPSRSGSSAIAWLAAAAVTFAAIGLILLGAKHGAAGLKRLNADTRPQPEAPAHKTQTNGAPPPPPPPPRAPKLRRTPSGPSIGARRAGRLALPAPRLAPKPAPTAPVPPPETPQAGPPPATSPPRTTPPSRPKTPPPSAPPSERAPSRSSSWSHVGSADEAVDEMLVDDSLESHAHQNDHSADISGNNIPHDVEDNDSGISFNGDDSDFDYYGD